jgi:hypothetical protein
MDLKGQTRNPPFPAQHQMRFAHRFPFFKFLIFDLPSVLFYATLALVLGFMPDLLAIPLARPARSLKWVVRDTEIGALRKLSEQRPGWVVFIRHWGFVIRHSARKGAPPPPPPGGKPIKPKWGSSDQIKANPTIHTPVKCHFRSSGSRWRYGLFRIMSSHVDYFRPCAETREMSCS